MKEQSPYIMIKSKFFSEDLSPEINQPRAIYFKIFYFFPFHSDQMPTLTGCLEEFRDECTFDESENFWSYENMGQFLCSDLDRKDLCVFFRAK